MAILLMIHSLIRWLIVLAGLAALIKYGMGWFQKQDFSELDRRLGSIFGGILGLQFLIGLIYMLWTGFAGAGFPRQRWEHAFIMILAVALGSLRWKKLEGTERFRNLFLSVLGAMVLIVIGVATVGGWT